MPSIKNNETLDAFRGLCRRKTDSIDRKSGGEPKHISDFAYSLFKKISKVSETKGLFEKISENWSSFIPAKFLGKCAPLNIKFGSLYVSVENPSLRQEMAFAERKILSEIAKDPDCAKIKRIKLI